MFFVQFEATPRQNAEFAPDAMGAYINCWIERPSVFEAIEVARAAIASEGWIVEEPDEAYDVNEATYPPGKDGREHFQQALLDQEVYVYYTFEDPDDAAGG